MIGIGESRSAIRSVASLCHNSLAMGLGTDGARLSQAALDQVSRLAAYRGGVLAADDLVAGFQ